MCLCVISIGYGVRISVLIIGALLGKEKGNDFREGLGESYIFDLLSLKAEMRCWGGELLTGN